MAYLVTIYLGYQIVKRVEHESAITSDALGLRSSGNGIQLQWSGAVCYNSLGAGERYHGPLRRIFSMLIETHPTLHPELYLRLNIEGLEETMAPYWLVPDLLLFGSLPSFPILSTVYSTQFERMKALRKACKKFHRSWPSLKSPSHCLQNCPPLSASASTLASSACRPGVSWTIRGALLCTSGGFEAGLGGQTEGRHKAILRAPITAHSKEEIRPRPGPHSRWHLFLSPQNQIRLPFI